MEGPVLHIKNAENNQQQQRQVQRIKAENTGYRETQPVEIASFLDQSAPKQKSGDHKEQRHAGQPDLRVKRVFGHIKHAGAHKDPDNCRMMNKYAECQITAQAIYAGKTVFGGVLEVTSDYRKKAQQQTRGGNRQGISHYGPQDAVAAQAHEVATCAGRRRATCRRRLSTSVREASVAYPFNNSGSCSSNNQRRSSG